MSTKQLTKQLLHVLKEHGLSDLQENMEDFGVYTVEHVKYLGREKELFDSFCDQYSLQRLTIHQLMQMCDILSTSMSTVKTSTTSSKRKASVEIEILEESSSGRDVVDRRKKKSGVVTTSPSPTQEDRSSDEGDVEEVETASSDVEEDEYRHAEIDTLPSNVLLHRVAMKVLKQFHEMNTEQGLLPMLENTDMTSRVQKNLTTAYLQQWGTGKDWVASKWGIDESNHVAIALCYRPFCSGMKGKFCAFLKQTARCSKTDKSPWTLYLYAREDNKKAQAETKIRALLGGKLFKKHTVYCFTQDDGWLKYNKETGHFELI